MKLKFTILAWLTCLACTVSAQTSGGPDSFGYTWKNSNDVAGPSYSWIDVPLLSGAVQISGLADDNTVGPYLLPSGMTFHYYWYDINKFWVGSNGYVLFMNGQLSSGFPGIPSTTGPNDVIAPFMSDITFADLSSNPISSAQCWYWINNGHDSLVVSWINVPFWQSAAPGYTLGTNSFQIIFSLLDSSITYQYKQQNGATNTGATNYLVVGIENNSGLIGLQNYLNPISTPYVPINFAIKYYYPSGSIFTAKDATALWANNTDNGAVFLLKGDTIFTMNGMIKNVGNVDLPAFGVDAKVFGPYESSPGIKAQDNTTVGPLVMGQSAPVSFTNTYNPNKKGTYLFFVKSQYSADDFTGNDSARVELHVVETDTATGSVLLTYDNGLHTAAALGLSWTGGNGGAGIYIIPPYYPCQIDSLRFFIFTNPNMAGFSGKIFDDDGVGGMPSTELFSDSIPGPSVDSLTWNTIIVNPPVIVNDGGFYVAWMMNGNNISLGQDRVPPFSNRTFEVLGSSYAIYRSRESEDLMINAYIKGASTVGLETKESFNNGSVVYPNPAANSISLTVDQNAKGTFEVEIFSIQGKLLMTENIQSKSGTELKLDVSKLAPGIYVCRYGVGSDKQVRKFTIQ